MLPLYGPDTLSGQQLLFARWSLLLTKLWQFAGLQTMLPESHAAVVVCVYCRAIAHYQELRRRALIEVPIALLEVAEKYYNIPNSSQEVSGISGYFP